VPDLLDRIREEIDLRLAALRPLVAEHARLDAALQALGELSTHARVSPTAGSPRRPASRAPKKAAANGRKRAPRGANREAVLRAARERPGATSAELAVVSKVEPNTLYGLLARLVKAGELQKRDLPTGRTGYAPANSLPPAAP
jgi:hypothetical protein